MSGPPAYTDLAVAGVALSVLTDLVVLRSAVVRRRAFWGAYAIILVFQLVSNGVLTGRGIVNYDPAAIVGWRLVYAPVEDLLFGFALVTWTVSWWVYWGRRGVQRGPEAGPPRWRRQTGRAGRG